jgi:hypothetical protein
MGLAVEQLSNIFVFRDCPIAMPTWMMHREVYTASEEIGRLRRILRAHIRAVGGFVEGPGVSEDLVFFYQHVARGGTFSKVDEVSCAFPPHIRSLPPHFAAQAIMVYRHVASSASFALSKELLMQVCAHGYICKAAALVLTSTCTGPCGRLSKHYTSAAWLGQVQHLGLRARWQAIFQPSEQRKQAKSVQSLLCDCCA